MHLKMLGTYFPESAWRAENPTAPNHANRSHPERVDLGYRCGTLILMNHVRTNREHYIFGSISFSAQIVATHYSFRFTKKKCRRVSDDSVPYVMLPSNEWPTSGFFARCQLSLSARSLGPTTPKSPMDQIHAKFGSVEFYCSSVCGRFGGNATTSEGTTDPPSFRSRFTNSAKASRS